MTIIRHYVPDDHDDVVALWTGCFTYPAPHNAPELSIRRKTALDDGLFFVAEHGGAVAGTVMAGWDGHRGWIYSLAVAVSHRRKGIGRALMNRAISELEARDCPKVNLQVVGENSGVVRFYEKLGFNVENRISLGRKLYE